MNSPNRLVYALFLACPFNRPLGRKSSFEDWTPLQCSSAKNSGVISRDSSNRAAELHRFTHAP